MTSQRAMPPAPAARSDRPSGEKARPRASPGYARQAAGEKIGAAGSQSRTEPSKPARGHLPGVRGESQRPRRRRMSREAGPLAAGLRLPELHGRIEAAGGEDPAARRKRQARHHVGMPRQRRSLAARGHVPEPHLAVLAPGRQRRAIGRESEAREPSPYAPEPVRPAMLVAGPRSEPAIRPAGGEQVRA